MNGYIALYNRARLELHAASLYEAKQKAVAEFGKQFRKVKSDQVTVMLAEIEDKPVVHVADF